MLDGAWAEPTAFGITVIALWVAYQAIRLARNGRSDKTPAPPAADVRCRATGRMECGYDVANTRGWVQDIRSDLARIEGLIRDSTDEIEDVKDVVRTEAGKIRAAIRDPRRGS